MAPKQDTITSSKQNAQAKTAILIITADRVQDMELFYPYYRLNEAGFRVDVASPKGGEVKSEGGSVLPGTLPIEQCKPEDYALLYIPGGKAPQEMRKSEELLDFVRQFAASNKPISAICHGPQVLVSAELVEGHRFTSFPEVGEEITEAGGEYVNAPLVEDGQFITSRWPGDLPLHLEATLKRLATASSGKKAA